MKRRAFLVAGGLLGGGLALGYIFTPNRLAIRAVSGAEQIWLTSWVSVNADNTITILIPQAEMGQRITTALPMMLAEEMEADWSLIDVRPAPAEATYVTDKVAQGFIMGTTEMPRSLQRLMDYAFYKAAGLKHLQLTGGSSSVRFTGQGGMRIAGAAAKEMLLRAAAEQWQVAPAECRAEASHIHHDASGRVARFAELASVAATFKPPVNPALKSRQDYSLCGTSAPRVGLDEHLVGAPVYASDLRLDNMKIAAIRHAPVFGGDVQSLVSDSVNNRPGIADVVQIPGAVVVTADNYWRANQALAGLQVKFSDGGNGDFSSEQLFADFTAALDAGEYAIDHEQGDVAEAVYRDRDPIRAEYRVPFLAHAAMEPMNCVAWLHDGKLELWAGVQDPLGSRALAAETAQLDMENVILHPFQMGGSFGRKAATFSGDFIRDAVHLAQRVDYPVKLVWSREEDIRHDYYRPAELSRFEAYLSAAGEPLSWLNHYTDIGLNADGKAAFIPYRIARQQIARAPCETPVPIGYWRSVEHSYQGFFIESFIDELAHQASADPLEYRLALLEEQPRYQDVLRLAAEKIGWGSALPAQHGVGIAVVASFGSIVAEAALVDVSGESLKVKKIVAAVDSGEVIHPDIARDQVEGGIVYGLTAALYGSINIERGRVTQSNFFDYRMLRMNNTPSMEVHFIESGAPLGGMGEVGTPPVAAAVCNAIYAANGQRIRRLPLQDQFTV